MGRKVTLHLNQDRSGDGAERFGIARLKGSDLGGGMTDAAGSPARPSEVTGTSLPQPRFSALVIMTTHSRWLCALKSVAETTSAGRRWRVAQSV